MSAQRRRPFFTFFLFIFLFWSSQTVLWAQNTVLLQPSTSPGAGQPGITLLNVTGSNFPSGSIPTGNVTVTLASSTSSAAPLVSTSPIAITTLIGTTRRITFRIPETIEVSAPTSYQVSISGTSASGVPFVTGRKASLTINPPAALSSISPSGGEGGARVSVTLTGRFTQFVQGRTQAHFGPGISVGGAPAGELGPVTVHSPTSATAELLIDRFAVGGLREVQVQTGRQRASLQDGFEVSEATGDLIGLQPVAAGLTAPIGLYNAGDGSGRLFVVEQRGTIRILNNGSIGEAPFLNIQDRVASGGERGLLGFAFHPHFSENGRFFVNYTTQTSRLYTVISEFTVGANPDDADESSERILLMIAQPFANHNGGNIAFGPDGYLYIGMGDGGSANDPQDNGQNLTTLLGKMLRIDVDQKEEGKEYAVPMDNPFVEQANALPEIWAYGFRNPWRFSFDSVTGLLYAGDVGQGAREEIDLVRRGENDGWRIMEGTICTPGVDPTCDTEGLTLPIFDYPRTEGTTVVGGFVYRGVALPGLVGGYVYGDFGSGRIWMLRYDGTSVTDQRLLLNTARSISSFGLDEEGELYLVDIGGEILKIVP